MIGQDWTVYGWCGFAAAVSAVLRAGLDGARGRWRKVARVASSAFWGLFGSLLLAEWLELSPRAVVAVGALLGWIGYETTVGTLLKAFGLRLGKDEERFKPGSRG
ncbi:hypothetical protein Mterra_01120 [Calidithermus terrae]|uniref:LydA holin phage, holin superfamily III n=1 Tax=Calidithermus terrae TaxID=1408545 RepID=A0A399EUL8_9DEIN|nr:hypothetical protein [Calidithermus terrae]RIH87728.1 hypothetical protein Mterra_01120 [Calidithermus terrae]